MIRRVTIDLDKVPTRLNLSGLHAELRAAGSLREDELSLSILRDGAGTLTGFYIEIPEAKDPAFIGPVLLAHSPAKTDEEIAAAAPTIQSLLARLEALENG